MKKYNNVDEANNITFYEGIVLDYIVHLFILFLILSLIFFLFISQVERKSLNDSIDSEIKTSIDNTTVTPNPALGAHLIKLSKIYSGEDKAEVYYNDSLIYIASAVIIMLFICLLSVYLTMKLSAHKNPPIYTILAKNFLLFLLVGVVEYLFFVEIAVKYVPVEPSYIASILKDRLD